MVMDMNILITVVIIMMKYDTNVIQKEGESSPWAIDSE